MSGCVGHNISVNVSRKVSLVTIEAFSLSRSNVKTIRH